MKTAIPSPEDIERKWHLIDAEDAVLGRVASKAASILMGKHKPSYTPFLDTGDHVVVVNAAKVRLTGRKEEQKIYRRHSGYPGGLTETKARKVRATRPAADGGRSDLRECFRRPSWASRCTGSCRFTRVPSIRTTRRSQWRWRSSDHRRRFD